ncbi:MAG: hypothetical protein PSX80_05960 [bacterium]|nr:hypothetical protein [bacterium]
MSKNNVNPDHYKTAGRERPGQDVVQTIQKQKYTEAKAEEETREHGNGSKFIRGHAQASIKSPTTEKGSGGASDQSDGPSGS